jgi:TRAP-type C4-dicarboxylate transport system permease small subunit
MQKLFKGIQTINLVFALVAGIAVLVLTLVILYDVAFRYIFAKPLAWSIDFGELAMMVLVYMPAALLCQEGGHVRVEIVVSRFSGRKQENLELFTSLAGLCFAVLLEWQALVTLCTTYREGTLTMIGRLPVYPAIAFFVAGAFFLILQYLVNILQRITSSD